MEAKFCDISHLDVDAHLPPRKRLLAGLKKLNSDGNSHQPSTSSTLSEFDTHLNNLLRSHNSNLSPEEIVKASRSDAIAAVKAAEAARALAEEKAVVAGKAMAAAKSALELLATISEDAASSNKERCPKKNKMKKHVPVQMLYNKRQRVENSKTDEEVARNLHRVMNSSPRISKYCSSSDLKSHKHKRPKCFSTPEKSRASDGCVVQNGDPHSTSNGDNIAGEVDSEGTVQEVYAVRVDENGTKLNKPDPSKINNGESETTNSKEKTSESLDELCSSRRRGRLKQKKLPLSICTFRDQVNPKDELTSRSSPLTKESPAGKPPPSSISLFPVEPSANGVKPDETKSMWKCQAFKAPACIKQHKVVQS